MPERALTNLNPGMVSNVHGRSGQPLNVDPEWFTFDRQQRLTLNEDKLRSLVRLEISRATVNDDGTITVAR